MEEDVQNIKCCPILGVNIAEVDMAMTVEYIEKYLEQIRGNYICVSNVHTTIMSYENGSYLQIQNGGVLAVPDGRPLSIVGRKRGYKKMSRVAGPDLMGEVFRVSQQKKYRHFFYGSTEETLALLKGKLVKRYPFINIVGMFSPPFRQMTEEEDRDIIRVINAAKPDIIWVGLGAPKQEIWMSQHKDKLNGLMIGVGAGFDYYADKIKRAPKWMQKCSMEWLYRLIQDPQRLFKRYLRTNFKFIWLVMKGK